MDKCSVCKQHIGDLTGRLVVIFSSTATYLENYTVLLTICEHCMAETFIHGLVPKAREV